MPGRTRDLTLNVTVDSDTRGADRAARAIDGISDAARRVPDLAGHAGDAIDEIGDAARLTSRDVTKLDKEVERLQTHVKTLRTEAVRSGDFGLLDTKAFRESERQLKQLTQLARDVKRELKPDYKREAKQLDDEIERISRRIKEIRKEIRATPAGVDTQGLSNEISQLKVQRRDADRLRKTLRLLGAETANAIGEGFNLVPRSLRGKLIAFAVGVGAIMSPLLGAAIASAVTAALGLGGIAGGIALAARDPRVKSAAVALGHNIAQDMTLAGKDFVEPTVVGLGRLRSAWIAIEPDITKVLHTLSGAVEPLADGIAGFVKQLSPGLTHALDQGARIVGIFADELPELGDALGDMFAAIADGKGNVEGMRATMKLLGDTLRFIGGTIGWLSDRFDEWVGSMAFLTGAFEDVFNIAGGLGDAIGGLGVPLKFVGEKIGLMNDDLEDTQGHFQMVAGRVQPVAGGLRDVATAAYDGAASFAEWNKELAKMTESNLSAEKANIKLEQAIDDAAESLKDNGRTLDINTEAGRQNKDALLGIAEAANDAYEATLRQTGSVELASQKIDRGREQFEKLAKQMGLTKQQAHALADQMFLIPSSRSINFKTTGFSAVFENLALLQRRIKEIQTRIDIKATFGSSYGGGAHTGGGTAPGFASGGYPPMDGSVFTVNEGGPELMRMEGGKLRVFPSGRGVTVSPMGGGASRPIELSWRRGAEGDLLSFFGEIARKYVQIKAGGDVQRAFGR